jgi:hypothetical protein
LKKYLVCTIIIIAMIIITTLPVSAVTHSNTNGSWYMVFTVWVEGGFPLPFSVHGGGLLSLDYNSYTSPWPGYVQVVRNYLAAVIYNYYRYPYPTYNYPFGLDCAYIKIERFDNGVKNLTISSFTDVDGMGNIYDLWTGGEDFTNSYLPKDAGSNYQFVGTVMFAANVFPYVFNKTITKVWNY